MTTKSLVEIRAAEGLPLKQIAKEAGVSKQRVSQILQRNPALRKKRQDLIREKREASPEFIRKKERAEKMYGGLSCSKFHEDELKSAQIKKLHNKKANMKKNGVEFTVGWGDIHWPTHCPVLGLELDYFCDGEDRDKWASFDRIDCTKGYVPGNVGILSMKANRIKDQGTAEQHRKIADYIDSFTNNHTHKVDSQ